MECVQAASDYEGIPTIDESGTSINSKYAPTRPSKTILRISGSNRSLSLAPELETNVDISPTFGDDDIQDRKSSLAASIAHTTNYFIGVGVLGLPYAFRCSGWLGLPVLVLLGGLMAYSGRLIGCCLKEYSLSTYPDIAEVYEQKIKS